MITALIAVAASAVTAFAAWRLCRARQVFAAIRLAARAEPGAAEVDQLAAVLHQQSACGCAGGVTEEGRDAARTALRWMNGRQQGGESRDG